jgi:hypothetical protein
LKAKIAAPSLGVQGVKISNIYLRLLTFPVVKVLPGLIDEGFRVLWLHMLRQEEVPVDLVHVIVGPGEVHVQGVDRLLAIVREQRWDLGR